VPVGVTVAGRVSIRTDDVLIDEERFPGRQGRLVFAYLVAEHRRPVLRGDLAEAIWGETPPATWEKALGGVASKLRALLAECGLDGGQALTAAFGSYRLALPEGTWIDLAAAAEAVDAAEKALAADWLEPAKHEARRAASVASLPLLPGENGSWVEGQRRGLAKILLRALECLADACLRSGDAGEAARAAEEAIALEPFRESNHRRLMQAHADAGNTAEALRAYERCRRFLADELGAYPSAETDSIYRELLQAPSRPAPEPAVAQPVPPLAAEPVSRRKRPSRRAVAASALAAAAVGAGVALVVTKSGGSPMSVSLGANAVGVVDSGSGRIVGEIAVAAAPGEVAAAQDAVWMTSSGGNSVSRIDPATGDVRQTIDVGGGPEGIAVGGGAVWVANGLDGTVSRIDPTTNRVVQTITVGNGPTGVAYGEGAVWVTNSADGTISRIDPSSGTVTRTLPAAIGASAVAVAFGRLWVASPPSGNVVVLHPRSGRVLQRIGVGVDPDALTAGPDAIWVANRADGTIAKIDPGSAAVTHTVQVGRGPDGIAAGMESVWVANGGDGSLSRIDPGTGATVQTVHLGHPPQGIALAPTGIYVAVRSTGSEHLGGTLRMLAPDPFESVDPALAPAAVWPALILTNDGLVGFRRVGGVRGAQLVPDLAVALPAPTDGGSTYTFQVRPGIRYSDGRLVQPDDFRRGIERSFEVGGLEKTYHYVGILGADRCAKSKLCDLSRGIESDRAARTVTFHLKAPDADFLAKLALPPAFAVPPGVPARDAGAHAIPATGPYRIADDRTDTKTFRLVRNSRFREWSPDAQPRGYPDSISWSWRFANDPLSRVGAVERTAGDVAPDGGAPLPRRRLEQLAVRYPDRLHVNAPLGTTFFFLNTRVPPFDDVRARRAVNEAFDREAFVRLLGLGFAPACQILPPNFPGYRARCSVAARRATALDRARRLARASGTAGARVRVWVPARIAVQGRFFVSVLNSIGYRTRLVAVADPIVYYTKVVDSRVRAQAGYYTWVADYPSAADFIPPQLSCAAFRPASGQNGNMSEFCDPSIDAAIARATDEQDPAVATVRWQRIERSVLALAPVVPVYNRSHVDFVSERLGNYQYNPQWGLLLDQAWVK
jgi:peptide/nickel transport system substrate-binding protein